MHHMPTQTGVPAPRWIVYVRLSDLVPAVRNPKTHDLPAICASITTHGFTNPVLRCDRTGRMAAGHGRVAALHHLRTTGYAGTPDGIVLDDDGEWCVPVERGWASRDDAHLDAYVIADNRLTEAGGWDKPLLAEMLHSLATGADMDLFEGLGYTADEMDDLMRGVDLDLMDQGPEHTPDAAPDETTPERRDPMVGCPSCSHVFRMSESELGR